MAAKRSQGAAKSTASGKKRYYQPPSAVDKIRHRLADGVPTHRLLHYMHDRSKLPKDVRELAEAAEKLDQVRATLATVTKFKTIDELGKPSTTLKDLTENGARTAIDEFLKAARKALVLKTMKEPES